MHKRGQFEVGSKNRMKHNMEAVLIVFREKSKDMIQLYVLQSLDTFYPVISH